MDMVREAFTNGQNDQRRYQKSGILDIVQKYFWPNLRASYFWEINTFFLICDQMTNQTLQLTGDYLPKMKLPDLVKSILDTPGPGGPWQYD